MVACRMCIVPTSPCNQPVPHQQHLPLPGGAETLPPGSPGCIGAKGGKIENVRLAQESASPVLVQHEVGFPLMYIILWGHLNYEEN